MTANIMNEYINLTKVHMTSYMKLIFQKKFDIIIFDEFWNSYLNARYYDLNGYKNGNTLKTEILLELEDRKEKLLKKAKINEKTVEDMYTFFHHLMYFDRVSPNKDLNRTANEIAVLREELLEKTNDADFEDELKKLLKVNTKEVEDLLKKYDCSDFYISISNYKKLSNVYRVNLKYNFKMSMLYSNFAINKAFSTGTIGEDKLFIEYQLIAIKVIQDIMRGNFKKQYVVELAESLLNKTQKLDRILKVVSNQAIQDKLNFKIRYELFLANKEQIYRLMKRGYRFAVIIDDKFEGTLEAIEKLKVFKYVLLSENTKWYHNIVDNIDAKYVAEI